MIQDRDNTEIFQARQYYGIRCNNNEAKRFMVMDAL